MGAVVSAFVQYLITFIVFIAVDVAGAFCGNKIRQSRKDKDKSN